MGTKLAPVAGLLVATERRLVVERGAVEVHHAGTQSASDILGSALVGRRDVARQTVRRVVGDLDGLVFVLVGDHRDDRAEDLFLGDGHVVGDIGEDGGLHEVALLDAVGESEATGDEGGTFVDALADEGLDLHELGLGDDGTDGDALGGGVTDRDAFGGRLGHGHGLFHLGGRQDHAASGVAGLAGVHAHTEHVARHRGCDVGIVEDDVGRLAAEFLGDTLDRGRSVLGDFDTGAGRTGERHHVDVGVR